MYLISQLFIQLICNCIIQLQMKHMWGCSNNMLHFRKNKHDCLHVIYQHHLTYTYHHEETLPTTLGASQIIGDKISNSLIWGGRNNWFHLYSIYVTNSRLCRYLRPHVTDGINISKAKAAGVRSPEKQLSKLSVCVASTHTLSVLSLLYRRTSILTIALYVQPY